MTGHDTLIALRMRGLKPKTVQVFTEESVPDWVLNTAWCGHVGIHIGPREVLGLLDLRCLYGMRVLVSGPDDKRVREVFDAVRSVEPERAIGITSTEALDTIE